MFDKNIINSVHGSSFTYPGLLLCLPVSVGEVKSATTQLQASELNLADLPCE